MSKFIKFLTALLVVSVTFAHAQDAEFIWAEDDQNGSRVLVSRHINGDWQPPEKVIEDSNLNILPALGSNAKGHRIAVWSTVEGSQSVLKYSVKRADDWSAAKVLSRQLSTNLAPVVVFDENDVCWVFWSANDGDDDDIYHSRYLDGRWSRPGRVNPDNDVPDILPQAGLDNAGNIWVSWQTLTDQGYVEAFANIDVIINQPMQFWKTVTAPQIHQFKQTSATDAAIQPPDSFKARSRATLHLPNYRRHPSMPVDGNISS